MTKNTAEHIAQRRKNVEHVVNNLLEVQSKISGMSKHDRFEVSQKLTSGLRRRAVLKSFKFTNDEYYQSCEFETDVLSLEIVVSEEADQPGPIADLDPDIPY